MADPLSRMTTNDMKRAVRSLLIRLGRTPASPVGWAALTDRPTPGADAPRTERRLRKQPGASVGTPGRADY